MTTAIAVSGLVKDFGAEDAGSRPSRPARSRRGEVHGFLGPNGAGKTTTIRVLLGMLRADDGHVVLLGGDPWRDAVALHRRLAYVPGEVNLWPNLTGGEVIDLLGDLRGGLDSARRDGAARTLPARPDEEDPRLLQGQPAEGRPGGGVLLRRGALPAGRAHLRAGPADGGGLPGRRPGAACRRTEHPAVQPHPVRGGGAVRPGHDHPGGSRRRERHVRRAASPHPHVGGGRHRQAAGVGDAAGPACTTPGCTTATPSSASTPAS